MILVLKCGLVLLLYQNGVVCCITSFAEFSPISRSAVAPEGVARRLQKAESSVLAGGACTLRGGGLWYYSNNSENITTALCREVL